MRWTFTSIALLAAAVACACDDGDGLCRSVTCSGHGFCVVLEGAPSCACDPGFVPDGLACKPGPPCDGVTCSGHGICQEVGRQAICECDPGYQSDGLECVLGDTCLESGLACVSDETCCDGTCLRYPDDPLGYCLQTGCRFNWDCVNHADDGAQMCCVDVGGEYFICMKVLAGYSCGYRPACGGPCYEEACYSCTTTDSGDEICTHECATDNDCSECRDPADWDQEFSCQPDANGKTICQPWVPNACTSSQDCEDDKVCIPWSSADGQGMEGTCNRLGELPTGSECDSSANPNDLPPSERCAGFYCLWDHCTEVCGQDADCPDGMVCSETSFCMDAGCETVASIGMCKWTCCGLAPCDSNADCPDDQICDFYLPPDGAITKVCVEPRCDPAGQDCSDLDEACGNRSPACASGVCIEPDPTGVGHCSALCAADEDCLEPMVCQPVEVWAGPFGATITIDACRPLE